MYPTRQNTLSNILLYTQLLSEKEELDEETRFLSSQIQSQADKLDFFAESLNQKLTSGKEGGGTAAGGVGGGGGNGNRPYLSSKDSSENCSVLNCFGFLGPRHIF